MTCEIPPAEEGDEPTNEPMMHPVPVMIEREVEIGEPAGVPSRLSLR